MVCVYTTPLPRNPPATLDIVTLQCIGQRPRLHYLSPLEVQTLPSGVVLLKLIPTVSILTPSNFVSPLRHYPIALGPEKLSIILLQGSLLPLPPIHTLPLTSLEKQWPPGAKQGNRYKYIRKFRDSKLPNTRRGPRKWPLENPQLYR